MGGLAAGRPVLCALIFAFAAAALAAVGFRAVEASFSHVALSLFAALAATTAMPAALASVAPKNFWLRGIYAALAAGFLLALRRVVLQSGIEIGPFDAAGALAVAAIVVFVLALGAPLWRSTIGLSLIGLVSLVLAAAAGMSIIALEQARVGPVETAGAVIALSSALGAALAVQMSAAFSRTFAEGGANYASAVASARIVSAPALFSLGVGIAAAAFAVIADGALNGASLGAAISSARLAAGPLAFSLVAPLFLLAGALALKGETEKTALAENRRRSTLRPFLTTIRNALPPSSAIAAGAIFLIAAVVAGFEANTAPGVGETALVSAVAIVAAVAFVSLRTALMTTVLFAAAGRLVSWGYDLFGAALPTEPARIWASALAVILYAQLFLAWRDRRNPRRKTREVVQMALADSYFATLAAACVGLAAFAAAETAGLWREGVEAALYAGWMTVVGLIAGPALMTAIGALFGRD